MMENESLRERGRGAVRRVAQSVTRAGRRVTGQELGAMVGEFSETYTQVLLGVHQDLETAKRRLGRVEEDLGALCRNAASRPVVAEGEQASLHSLLVERIAREVGRLRLLAFGSLALATIAVGVALWSAI